MQVPRYAATGMAIALRYEVPPAKFDDLAQYDGSVIVERTKGTMSARCDKEEANFLAPNLAHDIVRTNKTVAQASAIRIETPASNGRFSSRTRFKAALSRVPDCAPPAIDGEYGLAHGAQALQRD